MACRSVPRERNVGRPLIHGLAARAYFASSGIRSGKQAALEDCRCVLMEDRRRPVLQVASTALPAGTDAIGSQSGAFIGGRAGGKPAYIASNPLNILESMEEGKGFEPSKGLDDP